MALAIPVQKKTKPVESKSEASDAETSKKRKLEDDEFQKCLDELDVSDAEEEGEEEPEEETGQGAEVSDGETTLELPGALQWKRRNVQWFFFERGWWWRWRARWRRRWRWEDGEEAEQEYAGQEDADGATSTALVAVEDEKDEKGKAITAAAQQGVMVAQKANSTWLRLIYIVSPKSVHGMLVQFHCKPDDKVRPIRKNGMCFLASFKTENVSRQSCRSMLRKTKLTFLTYGSRMAKPLTSPNLRDSIDI